MPERLGCRMIFADYKIAEMPIRHPLGKQPLCDIGADVHGADQSVSHLARLVCGRPNETIDPLLSGVSTETRLDFIQKGAWSGGLRDARIVGSPAHHAFNCRSLRQIEIRRIEYDCSAHKMRCKRR